MNKFEEEYMEERIYRLILSEQWLNRAISSKWPNNRWPIARYYHEYARAKSEVERAIKLLKEG